jgi:hypothetical protein
MKTALPLVLAQATAQESDLADFDRDSRAFLSPGLRGKKITQESKLLMLATHFALKAAKIVIKQEETHQTAIVMGTSFGGFFSYEKFMEGLGQQTLEPSHFACSLPCATTATLSLCWGIQGPCVTHMIPSFSEDILIKQAADYTTDYKWVISGYFHVSTATSSAFMPHFNNNFATVAICGANS